MYGPFFLGQKLDDENAELGDGVAESFSTTTTDAPSFDLGNRETDNGPAPPAGPSPPGPVTTEAPIIINYPAPPGSPSPGPETAAKEPTPDAPSPAAPAPAPEEAAGQDWRESLGNNKITVVQVASYIGGAACEDIIDYTNTLSAFQNEFYAHLTTKAQIAKNNVAFISANCHTLSAEERGVLNIARRQRRSANDVSAITIEAVIDDENVETAVDQLVTNAFAPSTKVTVQSDTQTAEIELVFGLVAGEVEETQNLDMSGNFFNGIQDACEPYREAEQARLESGGEAKLDNVVLNIGGASNGGKGGKGEKGGKGKGGKGKGNKRGRSRRSRAASAMWTREADAAAARATRHISESRLAEASVEQSNYDRFRRMETALLDAQSRERREDSSGISQCLDAAKEAKNFGFVAGYAPTYVDYTATSSSNFVISGANVIQSNNYLPPAAGGTVINVGGASTGGKGGKGEKGGKGKGGKGKGEKAGKDMLARVDAGGGKADKEGKDGKDGKKGPKTGKQSLKIDAAADHWSGHSGSGAIPAIAGVLVGIICTTLAISHYTKRKAEDAKVGTYAVATQEEVEEYVLPDDVQSGERSEYSPLIHI